MCNTGFFIAVLLWCHSGVLASPRFRPSKQRSDKVFGLKTPADLEEFLNFRQHGRTMAEDDELLERRLGNKKGLAQRNRGTDVGMQMNELMENEEYPEPSLDQPFLDRGHDHDKKKFIHFLEALRNRSPLRKLFAGKTDEDDLSRPSIEEEDAVCKESIGEDAIAKRTEKKEGPVVKFISSHGSRAYVAKGDATKLSNPAALTEGKLIEKAGPIGRSTNGQMSDMREDSPLENQNWYRAEANTIPTPEEAAAALNKIMSNSEAFNKALPEREHLKARPKLETKLVSISHPKENVRTEGSQVKKTDIEDVVPTSSNKSLVPAGATPPTVCASAPIYPTPKFSISKNTWLFDSSTMNPKASAKLASGTEIVPLIDIADLQRMVSTKATEEGEQESTENRILLSEAKQREESRCCDTGQPSSKPLNITLVNRIDNFYYTNILSHLLDMDSKQKSKHRGERYKRQAPSGGGNDTKVESLKGHKLEGRGCCSTAPVPCSTCCKHDVFEDAGGWTTQCGGHCYPTKPCIPGPCCVTSCAPVTPICKQFMTTTACCCTTPCPPRNPCCTCKYGQT